MIGYEELRADIDQYLMERFKYRLYANESYLWKMYSNYRGNR